MHKITYSHIWYTCTVKMVDKSSVETAEEGLSYLKTVLEDKAPSTNVFYFLCESVFHLKIKHNPQGFALFFDTTTLLRYIQSHTKIYSSYKPHTATFYGSPQKNWSHSALTAPNQHGSCSAPAIPLSLSLLQFGLHPAYHCDCISPC